MVFTKFYNGFTKITRFNQTKSYYVITKLQGGKAQMLFYYSVKTFTKICSRYWHFIIILDLKHAETWF